MPVIWKIRVKDEDGTLVAELDDFRRLMVQRRVNAPGQIVLAMNGNDSRTADFQLDGQVEAWRRDQTVGLQWYAEHETFFRSLVDETDDRGYRTFTAYCAGYLDLAAREPIAYPAGTSYTRKSGDGSLVMRRFVNENIGPGANSVDRYWDGTQPGLTIGSTPTAGYTWSGQRTAKNLLETLQEIGDATFTDFDIVGTAPDTYEFRTYPGQRGTDRTTSGLDAATGLNSAGNAPLIFAQELGNMRRPRYVFSHSEEVNTVAALGPGEGRERLVTVRYNIPAVNASKRNRRAIARDARQQYSVSEREALGDSILQARQARQELTFEVIQLPGCYYGIHYTLGDFITARYAGVTFDKRIVGVTINVEAANRGLIETIDLDLADIS